MDAAWLEAFWGVSLVFAVTPGADWAFVISSGVRDRSAVVPAVSGILSGHLTATIIVAAGVAAVVAASPVAMTALTVGGSLYPLWLGVTALRHPASTHTGPPTPAPRSRLFLTGVGISLLNPKVFLLFLTLLPQFTSAGAPWPIGAQMIGLGALHVLNCAVIYFLVGFGAQSVLARRPRAARMVNRASGLVMIILGLFLLVHHVA